MLYDYMKLTIDRSKPSLWTVTFSNPLINVLDPVTITELQALVSEIETDRSVNALIFQAADPDFFIAHFDASKAGEVPRGPGPTGYTPWIDFVLRLSSAPVVSVAKTRARGVRATSSSWPAICASPAARRPSSATQRSVSDCRRAAGTGMATANRQSLRRP